MTTEPYQKQQLKSLTGLRFLAALSVFVAHVPVTWPEFEFGTIPFGAAGVSFFYVLSGFILLYVYGGNRPETNSDSGETEGATSGKAGFSFKRFYLKRFARIWPLHFATLLISLFLVMGVEVFFNHPHPTGKLLINGLLLQCWIPNYDWIYSLNGPSWSLSVEAFFYLVFPFLLLGGARKFVGKYLWVIVCTFAALLALGFLVPQGEDPWIKLNSIVHVNPLLRLFEFMTGVGCGYLYFHRRSNSAIKTPDRSTDSAFEFLAIGALVVFFLAANLLGMYDQEIKPGRFMGLWYWFRFSGAAPVFALVIFTFARTNGVISGFVSSRLMVYLGEISYSFYMIHMSVMLVMVRQDWIEAPWVVAGQVIASLLISLFLSSALYHLVELPFRRAIVDWFDGRGLASVFGALAGSVRSWVVSPWFVPMLALAVASGWYVHEFRIDIRDRARIDAIVAATDSEIQNAQFESDATLLGVRTRISDDGGMLLELVWQLKPGRRTERFIKLLDENLSVIARGDSNRSLFGHVTGEDVVIDRVQIEPEKMVGVRVIAIGFFDPERKAAVVDRGPRSARDRQLHVWVAE